MDLALKNKVVFIAASSDGLGKAVAMELANEGATIIINGRNIAKLEKTRIRPIIPKSSGNKSLARIILEIKLITIPPPL